VSVQVGEKEAIAAHAARNVPLRFTEETPYTVEVQSRTGETVAVHHRDPVVTAGLATLNKGRLIHGSLSFGAHVGTSRFVLLADGRSDVAFTVTVSPTKVSTADVAAMRREVEATLAGLGAAYLRSTQVAADLDPLHRPARPVWLTQLRGALPDLERALQHIARHPREVLIRPVTTLRADRITRPDPVVLRALRRGQGAGETVALAGHATPIHTYLPAAPARRTLDTPAHCWLRARIEAAVQRLAAIRREEATRTSSRRRRVVLAELMAMEHELRRLLTHVPLAEASSQRPPLAPPLVLRTVAGYAEAYQALEQLHVGLAVGEGQQHLVPRDLAALYEIWCLVTVAHTVGDVLNQPLPAASFFRATARGVRLRLRRGHAQALRFQADGLRVRLAYEPRFAAPGLLVQRPDLLLTVEHEGEPPRLFVLDAKYRRDDGAAYQRRQSTPGPPDEALGDLHRYRDAIVTTGPEGLKRPIEEAVALFPFQEVRPGAFAESRLWTSIEQIGVGAMPLLPGHTAYLATWLRRVLGR
ncbi:MAG: DUF2357 domain-containing protein, partial [Rhodothermaceae bacterium]|nr:DUF2357 domain-containing protein [Rhodothermaceae bacterium]